MPDAPEIIIRGARVNNLKNIDVNIPHNKLVVVTGLSGSGKTSLVFDTIYAEGQRRYIESLSSYARQFLERINKPDVDFISGLAPSMAIERKTQARNPRSTVGTSTELYDYLRLLFARLGRTYSPISGKEVKRDSVRDVLNYVNNLKNGTKVLIAFPLHKHPDKSVKQELDNLKQKGFFRIFFEDEIIDLSSTDLQSVEHRMQSCSPMVIADRFTVDTSDPDFVQRVTDSTDLAYNEGDGYLSLLIPPSKGVRGGRCKEVSFNLHLELDGIRFEEPEPILFSFNNPLGACPKCQGFGETIDLDPELIVPDKTKTVYQNAIHPFSTPKHSRHLSDLIVEAKKHDIRLHVPFKDLTKEELNKIYHGIGSYIGIRKFFRMVEREAAYKIHYRVLLSRYRAYTMCAACNGSRLRKEALYVKFHGKTIHGIVTTDIESLHNFFKNIKLTSYEAKLAGRILEEIRNRLKYLYEVGLGYLTLDRLTSTLSGGENQRINLATMLGSSLVGSIYVLDEPSIGLHPRDNDRLIRILKNLRDMGNSVLVVEHDPEMIKAGDHIIDIGPKAGENGGEIMYSGSVKGIKSSGASLTGKYLSNKLRIEVPEFRRAVNGQFISLKGASENNLKNIDVDIPLGVFVCITGVSGSGKSSLVNDILYGALKKKLEGLYSEKIGAYSEIRGYGYISAVELVDQSPIGRTPRSNPATYLKVFDSIRELFGSLPASKLKGFTPGSFSFNIPGGRCEPCEGSGVVKIAMQFMADIYLTCDVCKGRRYRSEILDIKFKDKNISDVLDTSVSAALSFFKGYPKITTKLRLLDDIGLGYLKLGQSATTLSGGEAQRIKLAYHLSFQSPAEKTLFIFDEPTTGLHLHDISKLLRSFNELLKKGNSIIVVEHNLEVIKCADYIIDLGPESGEKGGWVVAAGTPEQIAKSKNSITGKFLAKVLG
jgi:excinuclease ABC subunit A